MERIIKAVTVNEMNSTLDFVEKTHLISAVLTKQKKF